MPMIKLDELIALIDEQIKTGKNIVIEDIEKRKHMENLKKHEQEMKLQAPKGNVEAREVTKNKISFLIAENKDINIQTIDGILEQYHINYFENIYTGGDPSVLKEPIDEEIADYLQTFSLTKHDSFDAKRNKLAQIIYQELYGYSILDELIFETTLNEVTCTRYDFITIQYKGVKRHIPNPKFRFKNRDIYKKVISDRMLAKAHREMNDGNSMENCILDNGARVTATQPPLSRHYAVTVRLHTYKQIEREKKHDKLMPEALQKAIILLATKGRRNVCIIGEMGSGKTTAADEIIIKNIEDNVAIGLAESIHELNISEKYPNKNVIEFQYEGYYEPHEITAMMLRFNRDIIMYGEVRTHQEAFELIKAMLRQSRGSLCTFHSSTPQRAIHDLRQLLMQTGYYTDYKEAQFDVADALDIIIQLKLNRSTGKRYVYRISEVIAYPNDMSFKVIDIYRYDKESGQHIINPEGISQEMIDSCLEYEMTRKELDKVLELIKSVSVCEE
jgi:pilus assembly protein CpaF